MRLRGASARDAGSESERFAGHGAGGPLMHTNPYASGEAPMNVDLPPRAVSGPAGGGADWARRTPRFHRPALEGPWRERDAEMPKSGFENALLQLFLQAEAEGRSGTAEHLMRALEAFYADPGTGVGPPPARNGRGVAAKRRRLPGAARGPRQNGAAARDRR